MVLPGATEIAAGYTFAAAVWTAFPIFAIIFALIASVKVGGWVLRTLRKSIPG